MPSITTIAINILAGDVITEPGCIPVIVTDVRKPICGFTPIEYECSAGCGLKLIPCTKTITVLRALIGAPH